MTVGPKAPRPSRFKTRLPRRRGNIIRIFTWRLFLFVPYPSGGTAGADPCALFSVAEIEELLGESVQDPEHRATGLPLGRKLRFSRVSSSNRFLPMSVLRTEEMSANVRAHGLSAPPIYRTTGEMIDPVRDAPGVGHDARRGPPPLHILKGSSTLVIGAGDTDKAENLEPAKRAPAKVLDRLQQTFPSI